MRRVWVLAALVAVLAVPLGAAAQDALIVPMELDFGWVALGASATLPVTITSNFESPLTIFAILIADNPSGFFAITAMPTINVPMLSGQSVTVDVTYAPTSLGQHGGVMAIVSDDAFEPITQIALVDLLGESTTTVPEPSTALLFGAGLAGLGVTAWRRARRE